MKRQHAIGLILSIAIALLLAATARADVANLSVTSDTFIMSGPDNRAANPNTQLNNGGANPYLTSGQDAHGNLHRALFQFDLTSIPSGSVVTSVVFTESVVPANKGPFGAQFGLHAVQGEWAEGAGNGAGQGGPASSGEIDWGDRMMGVAAWTNAGGDFDSTVLATATLGSVSTFEWSDAPLLSVVQGWINNPASNNGLILLDNGEGSAESVTKLGSLDGGAPATLQVGYTLPAPPPPEPVITSISIISNHPQITWTSTNSAGYEVFRAYDLTGTQIWNLAEGNIGGDPSGTNLWADLFFTAQTNRILFYRVRAGPLTQ